MEGINFPLESLPDDENDSVAEKKDKKSSAEKKRSIFERVETEEEKKHEQNPKDKAEKKDEVPVPLEELAEDEKQQVAAEVVAGLKEDNQQELMQAPEDSAEEQEALVGATFAEALEQELETGTPVEEAIEAAAEKTQEIANIEAPAEAAPETPDDDADEEDDPSAAAATTAAASSTTPTPPIPPTPPSPPGPPTPPVPPAPPMPGPNFNTFPPTPNLAPNINPNVQPTVVEVRNRRRERTNLLVGGILGYMIGRRRGRIKTEKKLLPIQEKLEKQVKTLEQSILDREQKLRAAARERYEQNPVAAKQTIQRMEELHVLRQSDKKPERFPDRRSERLPQQPERLGKFAVLAEKPLAAKREAPKPVELMSVPELLEVAAQIKIQESSVKRLHETNRLNDDGLRRIVKAYLRGERHDHILIENLLSSPEIKRLPQDDVPAENSATAALRQALAEQSSNSFALPSLNNANQPANPANQYAPLYQPKPKRDTTKLVAGSAVTVVAVLLLLLLIF